ncbi:RDD family protein [Kribbella sandramycini]|uniref:Putative RDD family membrane protein YckC n=1 Tax=Kribbella sandramycini TaxID=60450 RepID=A0A7Y4P299_9ACTN|nr:putative RDD family membrane protein YckC [Kribbella sandramycini]NOL42904.1 RDD family protein [Kribbella sandramycini]
MSFQAGWYDDPENQSQQRYWDGNAWTDRRRPKYGQPAPERPQDGQSVQHGQVFGGAGQQAQQPFGQPQQPYGQPQQGQQQHGQQYGQGQGFQGGYQPYPQQAAVGYGAPGQNPNRVVTPDGQPLSGWWRRVFAYIIDSILSGLIALVFSGYFVWKFLQWAMDFYRPLFEEAARGGNPVAPTTLPAEAYKWIIPASLISLAVQFAYQYFFLTKAGATPGKMLLSIAVRQRGSRGYLPPAVAAKRVGFYLGVNVVSAIPLLGQLVFIIILLDWFWPLWDDKKQALHDKWPGTQVVRT